MTKAIVFQLKSAGWKAGKYNIGYRSWTSTAGRQVGSCEVLGERRPLCAEQVGHGVIGTFNSGCAEIEVPITNRAGLQYVSPANTYIGLTHKPALPGEPKKYYPTGKRTYARVVAADDFQGSADVLQLKALGAKSVYVLNDKEAYGFGVASAVANVARGSKSLGVKVVGFEAWDPKASSYSDLATKIKASGAQSVFLGGLELRNSGELIKGLRAVLGADVILEAPDGFSSFKDTIAHAARRPTGCTSRMRGPAVPEPERRRQGIRQGVRQVDRAQRAEGQPVLELTGRPRC